MLIKGATYVYSRVHRSSFEFTKPDCNHFAELIKIRRKCIVMNEDESVRSCWTRRKCIVMNEDELVRSCWINSRSVWFGVYRQLNMRDSFWPSPFLFPFSGSPLGVEWVMDGMLCIFASPEIWELFFFHDAYVRHKTKITFNVSGLFISYHNILFGIECATST